MSHSHHLIAKRLAIADYHMPTKKHYLNESLKHSLDQLPNKPGVYQYFNAQNQLLYVGKAKNLKKRVWSYFKGKNHSPWTQLMIEEINSVQVTTVTT